MAKKREFSPMKTQWVNPDEILCKDCIHRDKEEIKIGDKTIKCGVTKSFCDMFIGPPIDNGKPNGILFNGDDCDFYEEE